MLRETYNLAKRQFFQKLHRSKMGNLLKKGKEKGRGKGEGGQRGEYLSNAHILDWTDQVPQRLGKVPKPKSLTEQPKIKSLIEQ